MEISSDKLNEKKGLSEIDKIKISSHASELLGQLKMMAISALTLRSVLSKKDKNYRSICNFAKFAEDYIFGNKDLN